MIKERKRRFGFIKRLILCKVMWVLGKEKKESPFTKLLAPEGECMTVDKDRAVGGDAWRGGKYGKDKGGGGGMGLPCLGWRWPRGAAPAGRRWARQHWRAAAGHALAGCGGGRQCERAVCACWVDSGMGGSGGEQGRNGERPKRRLRPIRHSGLVFHFFENRFESKF